MKKLLATAVAGLTLLSAFPLMAKDSFMENKNWDHDTRGTMQVDVACMQAAVKKQSADFISAYNTYNQSLATAFTVRADAQVAAWAKVNVSDRMIALAASEKAFTNSYNAASRVLNQTKQTIKKEMVNANIRCRSNGSSNSSVSTSSTNSSTVSSASSIACQNLSAKLKGAFTVINNTLVDVGRTYSLAGTGSVSGIGSVDATGTLHALGFIATGHATGDITLKQGSSTLVLHVEGPAQTGFSALPTKFHYTVQTATGVFANLSKNAGDAELKLKGDLQGSFTLDLSNRCDR